MSEVKVKMDEQKITMISKTLTFSDPCSSEVVKPSWREVTWRSGLLMLLQ